MTDHPCTMIWRVLFRGEQFYLMGDPSDGAAPLCRDASDRANGVCSYAHVYFDDGGYITRFGEPLGRASELEFVEQVEEPEGDALTFLLGVLGDSWPA